MIESDETQTKGSRPGARSHHVTVVYDCQGQTKAVTLALTHLTVFFFHRYRRDEIWGRDPEGVTVIRTDRDWESLEDHLVEGPAETDEPANSGDCFCFEDDGGNRYCVCGM